MANDEEARVKLTSTQLRRLKSAVKKKKDSDNVKNTLKNFQDEELSHYLFLTIRLN